MKKSIFAIFYVLLASVGIQFAIGCGPTLPPIQESMKKNVTVLDFGKGSQDNKNFGTPMSSMLTTELFKLNMFHIVEREKIKFLLDELALEQFKVEQFRKMKISGIDYIIDGSAFLIKNKIHTDIRLINTENGETITVISDADNEDDLRDMAERVAMKLVDVIYRK